MKHNPVKNKNNDKTNYIMKFFKTFLAALLAVVVGFGLVVMMWTMILVGMVSALGSSTPAMVSSGSVLRLNLGTITDSPSGALLDNFDLATMTSKPQTSLLSAIQAIQAAATDDRIEGIYINFDETVNVTLASCEEIRAELVKFRESGKFIVAYQENWSQIAYWFASVADRIYTNPEGGLQWTGLSVNMMFYKGLLDKLGIEPIVVRHGSFKSAVEPFIMEKMSPENRLQYQKMVGSLWGMVVDGVAESRGIAAADLQKMADELAIDSPKAAVENGLLDGLRYEDEVMNEIAAMIAGGWSRDAVLTETAEEAEVTEGAAVGPAVTEEVVEPVEYADIKTVSFGDYASQVMPAGAASKNKIAVIYAEGSIVSGRGAQGEMGSASMVEKIKQAREDENVKAVVFRINSPGGSALASEVMWRELTLLKAEKPLIVSMGNYAASGGYYIAAPADAIYADRSTLTGSIGVFGLYANVGGALKGKLGVTTDVVGTNRYSDIGSMYRNPSPAELAYFQKGVEDVYTTFVGHVAEGRNMTPEAVDKIGQGRVWSGVDALEIGLIDGFGGVFDAIALAADRVGVADDFRIYEVIDTPTGFEALLSGLSVRVRRSVMQDELGEAFVHYEHLRGMLDGDEVQARMPYVVEIR